VIQAAAQDLPWIGRAQIPPLEEDVKLAFVMIGPDGRSSNASEVERRSKRPIDAGQPSSGFGNVALRQGTPVGDRKEY